MGKSSTKVTAGIARVECLNVLRLPDPCLGKDMQAYARLSFRPYGSKHELTLYFYPNHKDVVQFLMDAMNDRDSIYMEVAGLRTPIPFFDSLAHMLGFTKYWMAPSDVVHMNVGDAPIRLPA